MSTPADPDDPRRLASRVASAYYLEGRNKMEIATDLGISRFRVARLLDLARSTGIVTFTVRSSPQPEDALAAELRQQLNLRECMVTRTDHQRGRFLVATAAAGLLATHLTADDVLGLSWGRTLAAMTGFLGELPPASVVQLTGSVGDNLAFSPLEIMRKATAHSGGRAYPIVAPIMTDSVEAAATIRRQPEIRRTLDMYANLTMAAVSVGSWNPSTTQLREYLTAEERSALEARRVEGEVAGIFLTREGEVIDLPFRQRMIGIREDELQPVPHKLVVAEGAAKAGTVRAAILAGLVNSLIVDEELGLALRASG